MLQKMLVCSDGSPGALNAAQTGAALAQRLGCAVALINVLDTGLMGGGDESSLSIAGTSLEGIICSQQEAVHSSTLPVFAAAGLSVQSLSERGHPVSAIVAVAQREGCDLIVVGSQGRGSPASLLFGSVADGVLRHAACSVLIVPGGQEMQHAPNFNPLLLASDASASAAKAAALAEEIAAKLSAALTIVNVYEEPGLLAETADALAERYPQEQEQRVIEAIKQNMANVSQTSGVPCTLRQEKGRTVETILRVAREEKTGMIVLGHRGQGGFEAMLLGSVSGRVAQRAPCPVLVAR